MTDSFDTHENTDFEDDSANSGKGGLITALVIFIILFAVSAGILVYKQVQGDGGLFTWDPGNGSNAERIEMLEADKRNLEEENTRLQDRIAELQHSTGRSGKNPEWLTGTTYEVQIGAFKYFDMGWYQDEMVQLQMERDKGLNFFTIGRFRDLDRARNFHQDIQRLGFESAVIIKRVDGTRQGYVN